MEHKKYYLLASFFGLIITTFAVSSLVSAANKQTTDTNTNNDYPPCQMGHHGDFEAMQAQRAAIDEALANGDYDTWKSLMNSNNRMGKISEVINQDNFPQFVQMNKLSQAGDFAGAQKIAEELGLPQPDKFQPGKFMRGPYQRQFSTEQQ